MKSKSFRSGLILLSIFVLIIFLVSASPSIIFEEPPTPTNGSIVHSSSQTIVANISDTGNSSSWIDFDRSLVGYWSMDYFNETGVFDNSTYNNFGTFNGGLNYSNLTTGARGQGLTFDGDNDYLTMEDISNMTQQFTVSVWVKTIGNSTMGEGGIIHESYQWGSPHGGGFFIIQSFGDWVGGSGMYMHARIGNYSDSWDETSVNIDEGYPLDTWRFYTVVWDYPDLRTYLNGNFFANITFPYTLNTTWNNLQIGSSFYNWDLNGSIDEVMIFNRSLSETEILALYNSQENKFNATFTDLTEGQHNYTIYTINESGATNNSEERYFVYENPSINICKNLSTAGQTYTLTSNVYSNGTCFTITAPNITLECNAYWINYSLNGEENGKGLYSNQFNTTIRNCNFIDGNYSSSSGERYGIHFENSNNGTIYNNYIQTNNSQGILISDGSQFNLLNKNEVVSGYHAIDIQNSHNNSLFENIGNSTGTAIFYSSGIILYGSSNNILINNTAYSNFLGIALGSEPSNNNLLINNTAFSLSSDALEISSSDNNIFISQSAITLGNPGTRRAIIITDSNNNLFRDCINLSGLSYDVMLNFGSSLNNTFVNCSYNPEKELLQSISGELIRKWYYQAYVNYSNGSDVVNANVTAYNASGNIQFSALTNSSGWIERQEVIEYINVNGTKSYYNNYTINASEIYYITDSNLFNFTDQTNKINDVFTLEDVDCGNLDVAGQTYTLTSNVSSNGTCFTITQPNITLDCNGYWVNYSINGTANSYGVYSNQFNTNIKNCNVLDGNWTSNEPTRNGIYFNSADNGTIFNNSVMTNSSGAIYIYNGSDYNNLTKNFGNSIGERGIHLSTNSNYNHLENNTGIGGSQGIRLTESSYNKILDNNATGSITGIGVWSSSNYNNFSWNIVRSSGLYGFYILSSNNNTYYSNIVIGGSYSTRIASSSNNNLFIDHNSSTAGYAIYIDRSNNTLFQNCIYINGESGDVVTSGSEISINNTLINCFYDTESVSGAGEELIRKWYYQAHTNYSNGSDAGNANVTAYNTSGEIQFSALTNSSGWIERQEVTEYINTGGTRSYFSNYTVNATKSGYTANNSLFNLTTENNKLQSFFTFYDLTSPTYSSAAHNSTTAGEKVKFSINVSDGAALHPNGRYIFSTNNSGNWTNDTAYAFNSTPSLIYTLKVLSSTEDMVVGYRWYFNDSAGNRNSTRIYTLITEAEEEEEEEETTSGGGGEEDVLLYRPAYQVVKRGYEGYFRETDRIQINLSTKGIHLFEIEDVNRFTDNVSLIFNGTTYFVPADSSIKINVDGDTYYDLQISVIDVTLSNSTRINFKEINEEISASFNSGVNDNVLGNKSTITIFGENDEEETKSRKIFYFIVVGSIVVAMLLVVSVLFIRLRKTKKT